MTSPSPCPAVAATVTEAKEPAVQAWAACLASHAACNREQRGFCEKVAERVAEELREVQATASVASEPLRRVLHGRPGTGKSRTLDLFEEIRGWQHGVDFQIVSFQAVMAELLDGDTIHHPLGLELAAELREGAASVAVAVVDLG